MAVRTITTRLALDGETQFKQAMTSVNASLRAMKSELALNEAQFKGQANTVEALTAKDKLLRKEIEQQTEKVKALEQALQDAAQVYGEDSTQVSNYQAQLNRAKSDLIGMNEALEENGKYLEEANNNFYRHATSIDEYGNKVEEAGEKTGDAFEGMAEALKAAGVALAIHEIVDALKECVNASMQLDDAMATVAATMGVEVSQVGELRDFAREMGATTAFTATEAAQALNYMALAGYDAQTSMGMLPTVLNLAAAGGVELASASDMITDAQSALGLSLEETTRLVDEMALTSTKTNTSVGQLGEAILTVGGTAKFMAGGTAELNQVLGLLADNSIKGTEGGTKLRNMILSLSAPTDAAAAQLDALGVSVFDAEGNMRQFAEIFPDLQSALSSLTDQQQLDALATIFNTRDIAAAQALLGTTTERWYELSGAIDQAAGSAEEMAGTRLDSLAGDMTLLNSAAEALKISIGDALTPALRGLAQTATSAFTWMADILTRYPFLVDAFVGVATALGVLGAALNAHKVYAIAATAAQAALNAIMNANPYILAASAIAGVVVALTTLISRLNKAKDEVEDFTQAADAMEGATDGLADSMTEAVTAALEESGALEQLTAASGDAGPMLEELSAAAQELEEATLYLAGANDTLSAALEEQSEQGRLSLQTTLDLIDAGYGAAIAIDEETGAITLNREEYIRLASAKIQEQISTLESKKAAAEQTVAIEAQTDAVRRSSSAFWESAGAQLAAAAAAKDDLKSLDAQIAALKSAQSSLGSYTAAAESSARRTSSASKQAKTQAQQDLEAYKQLKAELDHQKSVDLVDEAEYYRKMAEYRDQYLTDDANVSEYRKVTEQIYKYDKSLADQEAALWADQTDTLITELEGRVKSLTDQQDKMEDRLSGYGDLFKVSDNNMTLENIQEQIDAIDAYEEALTRLKERNISEGLMDEVLNMDVDSATQYANQLLAMSEDQWEQYNNLWDEKQQRAMEVAEQFFKDQLNALETDYNDKLGAALDTMADTSFASGEKTGQELIDGLASKEAALYEQAKRMADQVNSILAGAGRIPSNSELAASFSTDRIAERFQGVTNAQLQSAVVGGVNAMNTAGGRGAAYPPVDVTLNIDGQTLARAQVDPMRQAFKERPETLDDK